MLQPFIFDYSKNLSPNHYYVFVKLSVPQLTCVIYHMGLKGRKKIHVIIHVCIHPLHTELSNMDKFFRFFARFFRWQHWHKSFETSKHTSTYQFQRHFGVSLCLVQLISLEYFVFIVYFIDSHLKIVLNLCEIQISIKIFIVICDSVSFCL